MKPEILLLVPIYAPVLAQLEQEFTVHKLWQARDPRKFMATTAKDVRVAVTTGLLGFRADAMERLSSLELVACFGTPHGTVDYETAREFGITVTNTPDHIADAVGELAAGMTVALMRRVCENDRFVRRGQWPQTAPSAGNSLVGKACGIVGLGRIGREAAARLAAFGMSVSYQGPHRKADVAYAYIPDVEALAKQSDCLVVTCPSTRETRGLVDARILDALGPGGYLVNVARAPIVHEQALIEALKQKRIAGAALDVFWSEPRVPSELIEMENVVLLPHIGSTTIEIREERGRKLMANLRAHFSGKPVPHPVTG